MPLLAQLLPHYLDRTWAVRPIVLVLALGVCWLVLASSAQASVVGIVPGQSIDGVHMGETEAQVEQLLGMPPFQDQVTRADMVLVYKQTSFDGFVALNTAGLVDGLTTDSHHFSTAKGIHVGSLLKQVHTAYPKAKREKDPIGDPIYVLKSSYKGHATQTVFYAELHKPDVVVQIEVE